MLSAGRGCSVIGQSRRESTIKSSCNSPLDRGVVVVSSNNFKSLPCQAFMDFVLASEVIDKSEQGDYIYILFYIYI